MRLPSKLGMVLLVLIMLFSIFEGCQSLDNIRKAADQGDADAQNNLGVMYGGGRGVPQNYAEAMKCYKKAADQGHAKAHYNLGVMYENGHGMPKNYVKAYVCFSLAAALNVQKAKGNLSILQSKMTPEQIAEAQKQTEILRNTFEK